ncbi:MAG: hypothetical protein U1E47_06540 [Rivihabitans pingtungensis]
MPSHNDTVQVIDVLQPADRRHPETRPRHPAWSSPPVATRVWLSSRDDNRLTVIDTATLNTIAELDAEQPSGIFFTWRAQLMGMMRASAMPEPCRMNAPG